MKSSFFAAIIFGIWMAVFLSQLTWPAEFSGWYEKGKAALGAFYPYVAEYLALILILRNLLAARLLLRLLGYALVALVFAGYLVQIVSYYKSGSFLPPLALENINHIDLLLQRNANLFLLVGVVGLCLTAVLYLLEKYGRRPRPLAMVPLFSVAVLITVPLLPVLEAKRSPSTAAQRLLRENRLTETPPLTALISTIWQTMASPHQGEKIDTDILAVAARYGFHYDDGREYPLIRKGSHPPPPFPSVGTGIRPPNIIVFFTEGYSARNTNVYSQDYPGLTPNLVDFSQNAMVVDNYYNHTAATYRGLHGQLCSLYPKYGGVGGWHDNYENLPRSHYLCLPEILRTAGYVTAFATSQLKKTTFLDEMLYTLGFDHVFMADEFLGRYLPGEKPIRPNAISDHQLFRALVALLASVENDKTTRPFFIGIYNLGTHAFLDVPEDGVVYGDGKNASLNTIHNLDDAFGTFWQYFRQSQYFDDTIVIFTADHAHFHDRPFVAAFDRKDSRFKHPYVKTFVDQIPLIIYDPGRELPSRFDARYATSVNFTPTLLHYLGITIPENPFMGHSLFDPPFGLEKGENGVASFGDETFIIDEQGIHGGLPRFFTGSYAADLKALHAFMAHVHQLEVEDRIWH
ncbi:lipoteichoic acid synthase [Methylomarinovum tepidoasis]|uniref:Lipoteichoic acid synthase n=1 Tax=Methylomarinovum tepidoasis TaxID=2840183 RepID=A0AAU9BX06_9GAMM|nr:LTA synthase family protein [Methylomarinovum sp. IN45]BCX87973.1 lipoteichoic acid synthase [Methylomarinovum sp. IN45]